MLQSSRTSRLKVVLISFAVISKETLTHLSVNLSWTEPRRDLLTITNPFTIFQTSWNAMRQICYVSESVSK
jgi:hypothetical protein